MENEFKKKGADGKKLPEEIGKGLNLEHCKKVLKERENVTKTISFRVKEKTYNLFNSFIEANSLDSSEVLRTLLDAFNNDDIPTHKLDFIAQELTLKDGRITELEMTLENTISALKDYGISEDSIIIESLKNALNK